jgi:beta-galactosidase/beta-glucuronidase
VGQASLEYTVQAQLETVVLLRNHPSVVLWSLANESPWTANFNESLASYVRRADSTRPFMFDGGSGADNSVDVLTVHYPPIGFNPAP